MDYRNIKPAERLFYIDDFSRRAESLRKEAANPKARNPVGCLRQAEQFESIVNNLKEGNI